VLRKKRKYIPDIFSVDMVVTDDSWYVVRNTPRVTGFVGSGVHPVPLSEKEVQELFARMDSSTVKHTIDLSLLTTPVKIVDGPFQGS